MKQGQILTQSVRGESITHCVGRLLGAKYVKAHELVGWMRKRG